MGSLHGQESHLPGGDSRAQGEGRLDEHCRLRRRRYCNNRIESDHRQVKRRLRAMQGPRTLRTARRVVKGIEAVHMIRKGPGTRNHTKESCGARDGFRIPPRCCVTPFNSLITPPWQRASVCNTSITNSPCTASNTTISTKPTSVTQALT